jgi:hypothetical protein
MNLLVLDVNGRIPRDDAHETLEISFIGVGFTLPFEHEIHRGSRQGRGIEGVQERSDFVGDGHGVDRFL